MPENAAAQTEATAEAPVQSPPPAALPARETSASDSTALTLRKLALELMRCQNRRLLVEFLQLRRAALR